MRISFHGAAQTVTGSKHLITLENGTQFLLDCGMFQGMGRETDSLNRHFGFRPEKVSFLILSHAHIDHSGLIPRLVKEGFKGKIYATQPTRDLTEILLYDSAEIQTYEADFLKKKSEKKSSDPEEPLYTTEDVGETMLLFETKAYGEYFEPAPGIKVMFTNAGHIVGAAAVNLVISENGKETRITFSGDVGRQRSILLKAPDPFPQTDYLILESTYGDKRHDMSFKMVDTMLKWIRSVCIEKQGKLIIPAFSVGRTQELLYALNQLSLEKRLPELLYFVDSPLSLKATETIKKFPDLFNERLQQVLQIDDDPFAFEGLKYVESVEDSKKLVDHPGPFVVISASGTADAGRVKHHIYNSLNEQNHCILMAGYCGSGTLGGQLLKQEGEVEIFGETHKVMAEVGKIEGMSAHGDYDDLSQFISCQDPERVKKVFLVHGEYPVQKTFADHLQAKGFRKVEIPFQHQEEGLY